MTSGFVSTKDLDEERRQRQEAWEKVRKPDDALTAPEPEVCNQTLFEQLRNNKEVKDAEMEEAKKFKNMIRGIDEDESDFLAQIDSAKQEANLLKKQEELEMLKEMAKTQAASTSSATAKISLKPTTSSSGGSAQKSKQASILSMAIKRKTTTSDDAVPQKVNKPEKVVEQVGSIAGLIAYAASSDSESSCSDSDDEDISVETLRTNPRQKKQQNCGDN